MKIVKAFCVVALVTALAPAAMGKDPSAGDEKQMTRDQIRIAVQEICPVSGGKLGDKSVAVTIGKERVFLCCKSCASGKVKPEHWKKIHANIAKAQGICPVMKNKLPENAKWTIVDGQVIFVCCPPCVEKIKADPQTYAKKVDELYVAFLKKRKPSQ